MQRIWVGLVHIRFNIIYIMRTSVAMALFRGLIVADYSGCTSLVWPFGQRLAFHDAEFSMAIHCVKNSP